jgi:hypothetical protein
MDYLIMIPKAKIGIGLKIKMTYDNAIFPLALFHAAEITGREVLQVAHESLAYLEKITFNLNIL